jgi:hypothetical protein
MERTIDGRYTLIGRREAGALLTCHLAHYHLLGTQVLVDLVRREGLGGRLDGLAALLDRLVTMRHPSISRVLAWGIEGEEIFVVREFEPGDTLGELLEVTSGLPLEQALETMRALAAGLAYLHGKGIYFTGINPRQVHIDRRGRARIIRPGYAGLLEAADLRLAREVAPYMAPEVLEGEEGTRLSDIYSLGVMAGQLLPHARELPRVRRCLRRAAAAEPQNRYPSARVFLESLEEALGEAAAAAPGSCRPEKREGKGSAAPRGRAAKEPRYTAPCAADTGAPGAGKGAREAAGSAHPPFPASPRRPQGRRPRAALGAAAGEAAAGKAGEPVAGESASPGLGDPRERIRGLVAAASLELPPEDRQRKGMKRAAAALLIGACGLALAFQLLRPHGPSSGEGAAGSAARPGPEAAERGKAPASWLSMPDLRGLDWREAQRLLRQMGTEVEVVPEPSRSVPEGKVIIQEPLQGEDLRPDTRVRLFVSSGPLPDGGRRDASSQQSGDGGNGFKTGETPENADDSPPQGMNISLPADVLIGDRLPGRSEADRKPCGPAGPGRCGHAA